MKVTHALGLTLSLALALTACSSSVKSTTGPSTTVAPTATTTAATALAPTPIVSAATSGAQVTTPTTPAGLGRCVSPGLGASLGQSLGAAGTFHIALLLTNRSRVTCTLDGYPGVSFTAGTDAHQIAAPAQRDLRFGAAPVILVPGASVHVTVEVADYANYDQQACQPARATGYRIFPPGSTGSLLISAPQMVCSKPGLQSFQTSVVRTGTIPD
jgi:Protein of unknown function (DUF4232)